MTTLNTQDTAIVAAYARGGQVAGIAHQYGLEPAVVGEKLMTLCGMDRGRAKELLRLLAAQSPTFQAPPDPRPRAVVDEDDIEDDDEDEDDPLATVEGLLQAAEAHPNLPVRRRAERVRRLLADLDRGLREERDAAAQQSQATRIREEAAARVAQLEAELAAARALARGPSAGRRPSAEDERRNTQIREWAAAKGIELATRGRIKASVREQYAEETEGAPAA